MRTILSAYSRRESILCPSSFTLLKPALPAALPRSISTVTPLFERAEHPTSPEMPFTPRRNRLLSNSTVIFILMTACTDYWLTPGIKIFRTAFTGSATTFRPARGKAIPRSHCSERLFFTEKSIRGLILRRLSNSSLRRLSKPNREGSLSPVRFRGATAETLQEPAL